MMKGTGRAAGAIAFVALSLVAVLLAATVLLPFPLRAQEHSEWCWAGTIQAVLAYYGTSVSQCVIANVATGRSDCCDTFGWSAAHACNGWNYMWGSSAWGVPDGGLQGILAQNGVQSVALASALTPASIMAELGAGRPFVMRFGWTSGGGHFLVG
jgi:hypothetical protein